MKKKSSKLIFEINRAYPDDILFKKIDAILEKYPNAEIHIKAF